MKQRSSSFRASPLSAFTLIELLVVIGIIGIMAGVIGIGLKGGDSSAGMRSAQSTLTTMVSAARGQAALNQTKTRLVVYADTNDMEKYLRFVQVAIESPAGSGVWAATNDGVYLPNNVYVVPPSSPAQVMAGVSWNPLGISKNLVSNNMVIAPSAGNNKYYYLEFTALGTTLGSGSNTAAFAVSTAKRIDASTVSFDNADNVRGLLVRKLGGVTLLNDIGSFQ